MTDNKLRRAMEQKIATHHYIILCSPNKRHQYSAAISSGDCPIVTSRYDTIFYYHDSPVRAIELAVEAHWLLAEKAHNHDR